MNERLGGHVQIPTRGSRPRTFVAGIVAGSVLALLGGALPALASPIVTPAAATRAPAIRVASTTIYFDAGSAALTSESRATLSAFFTSIPRTSWILSVRVLGYVQRSASSHNDVTLARSRATAAAGFLHGQGLQGAYSIVPVGIFGDTSSARRVVVTVTYRVRGTQAIFFAQPAAATLSSNRALSVRSTSGLPVTMTSTTPKVCTVVKTRGSYALHPVKIGTCELRATQRGNDVYLAAGAVVRRVAVTNGKRAQTITFPALDPVEVRWIQELAATASSGLPVSYTSTTPSVCTVHFGRPARYATTPASLPKGFWVGAESVGTCTIAANQAGNATYLAAPRVTRSFTVTAAHLISQTISFDQPAGMTVGDPDQSLSASVSSPLPVTIESLSPDLCTVVGSPGSYVVHAVAQGACTVRATQAGSGVYQAADPVSYEVIISPAVVLLDQTITFDWPADMRLGDSDQSISATTDASGLEVTLESDTPGTCSVLGTIGNYTLHVLDLGECTVSAHQPGNATYAEAHVSRTITIRVALLDQIITFNSPADMRVGDADQPIKASTDAVGLDVTIATQTPETCTVLGTPGDYTVHAVSPGVCSVYASQDGDATYNWTPSVGWGFTIRAALLAQKVTFDQPADLQLWTTENAVASTDATGLSVEFSTTTPSVCEVNFDGEGWVVHGLTLGTCHLVASQAGDLTYAPAADVTHDLAVSGVAPSARIQVDAVVAEVAVAWPVIVDPGTTVQFHAYSPDSSNLVSALSLSLNLCTVTQAPDGYGLITVANVTGECQLRFSVESVDGKFAATTVTKSFQIGALG